MQDDDRKDNSISESQLTPDGNRRLSLNEDKIQGMNKNNQNEDDVNQQIKPKINIRSSQNGSDDITGKKRSKNSVENENESILSSPARKKQKISKMNAQNSTNENTSMSMTSLTHDQLQEIQTEEQIAFQNQMIQEGIIPQPHVMQAIRQRQLMTQFTSSNNNNKNLNSKHRNNNNNNSINTYKEKMGNKSTNKHMKNNRNDGGDNDPSDDNDSISDSEWHNDSNSNSSDFDGKVRKDVKNSKTSNHLQNLQDQNDTLQKQLQESDNQINKLISSMSSGGGSNDDNNSNSNSGMAIYNSVIKQQQLQIKQLMK